MSTALELRSVSKTRGSGRQAVRAIRDVSLTIERGELVLLQGPSGSGKTTLLAVGAGLLTADHGQVLLAGRELGAMSRAARRQWRRAQVGFVFQRANLFAAIPARDNVMVSALLSSPRDEANRRCDALLDALGVADLASRHAHELSGGEEQRIAIARALVHNPTLVLADEPTANLDWGTGEVVAERMRTLARERNSAVLIATHDARLEPFADRRIQLQDGQMR